ncbi:hypothetical protein FOZ63_017185 [Perkinsus olseni]|nr:hypothetical protein FOZ63_017185 [Perkinsus olseni]
MKQLRKEIKATSEGSGGLSTLKNQMVGLREMLTRESGDHKDRVEKVREQLTMADGSEGRSMIGDDLEDSISSSHSLANKLFMLCIIVVVVGGLYVWRQLQVVEKKHLF